MSNQPMLNINEQLDSQNERIKLMLRTANETQQTSNNTMKALSDQGNQMRGQLEMNKQINKDIKTAGKTTNTMRRRNICMKLMLYITALILFAAIIVIVIIKLTKTK